MADMMVERPAIPHRFGLQIGDGLAGAEPAGEHGSGTSADVVPLRSVSCPKLTPSDAVGVEVKRWAMQLWSVASPPVGRAATILDAALEYAREGIPVFPLHRPDDSGRCSCGDPDCGKSSGKHPRTPQGFKDAVTDEALIRRWWRQWPDANIGIPMGTTSGVFVVDVDGPEGIESLSRLTAQHGPVPAMVQRSRDEGVFIRRAWYPVTPYVVRTTQPRQEVVMNSGKPQPHVSVPEDRYVIHGDLLEGSDNRYYCSALDVFLPSEHFEGERKKGCCGESQESLIRSGVKAYKRYRKTNGRRRRPDDAVNPWKTKLDVVDALTRETKQRRRRS